MKKIEMPTLSRFAINVYFGRPDDERFAEFAHRVFDRFRCPILRVEVAAEGRWHIARIRPLSFGELSLALQDRFRTALDDHTRASWRVPKTAVVPKPRSPCCTTRPKLLPPSSPRTLLFIRVGEQMGVRSS
jgi:hypothetical protein